tara:strand:- start:3971 stop:4159 length:189 start_codon:yes stop_codon:yes gene_type:complete
MSGAELLCGWFAIFITAWLVALQAGNKFVVKATIVIFVIVAVAASISLVGMFIHYHYIYFTQ